MRTLYGGGQQYAHFDADCPVCGRTVRVRYVFEWQEEDKSCKQRAGQRCHSPEVREQDCTCLLGEDWLAEVLQAWIDA